MSAPRPSIGNGGVRNLRAMFENSETTSSPEPRGRSPAASVASNSSTSHSTSKVRASFVSVDPSGLANREHSSARSTSRPTEQSPLAQRRASFSFRESIDTEALNELKQTMSQEIQERKNSVDVEEVIPEQAIDSGSTATPIVEEKEASEPISGASLEDNPKDVVPLQDTTAPIAESKSEDTPTIADPVLNKKDEAENKPTDVEATSVTPDKPTSVAEDKTVATEAPDAEDASAGHGEEALPEPQIPLVPLSDPTLAPAPAADVPAVVEPAVKPTLKQESKKTTPVSAPKPTEAAKSNGSSTIAQAKLALKSAASGKPPAISTSKAAVSKPTIKATTAPKSPAIAKSPRTATAPAPTKPAAPKSTQAAPKTTSSKAPRASTAAVASPSSKDKLTAPASSSTFVKPPPKSPTRPVKLPSHLTAPTASSAAKQDVPGAAPTATRKLPVRDRTSSVKPVTTVKKQSSRASLPGQPVKRPESRSSAVPPDSGFLARMMRPTASSSNKSHEKTEVKSPPRRAPALKPKASTTVSSVSKAKAKVTEGLAKAKDAVTSNGAHTDSPALNETKNDKDETATEAAADDITESNEGLETPDVTSGDLSAETPNFAGATIR